MMVRISCCSRKIHFTSKRQRHDLLYKIFLICIFVSMAMLTLQRANRLSMKDQRVLEIFNSQSKQEIQSKNREIYKYQMTFNNLHFNQNRSQVLTNNSLVQIYKAFLPHLTEKSLIPDVYTHVEKRHFKFVFGIPTVKREEGTYIHTMLGSMFQNTNKSELRDTLFLIFVAEQNATDVREVVADIFEKSSFVINETNIAIISPNQGFYPEKWELMPYEDDSEDRILWRTKQNLDYLYMWAYSYTTYNFDYYIQMEDDIIAKPSYMKLLNNYVTLFSKSPWLMLKVCSLGFIGNIFHRESLIELSTYFAMFYKVMPGDVLVIRYLQTKLCLIEDQPKCGNIMNNYYIRRTKSLFQHIGKKSSLKGKEQDLTDATFDEPEDHINPPATIETDFTVYGINNFENVYNSAGIFWATAPIPSGTYVKITFSYEINIIRIVIKTGNDEHQNDVLANAVLEGAQTDFENNDIVYDRLGEFKDNKDLDTWINKKYKIIRLRIIEDIPLDHTWMLINSFEIFTDDPE